MLILTVVFTVGRDMMNSFLTLSTSWVELRERSESRAETRIVGPDDLSLTSTTDVDITLTNEGDAALSSFEDWDVIFEIQETTGFDVVYLTYTTNASPGVNEWTVSGIYLDASLLTPEIVDPDVLNPGEDMIIKANPSPAVTSGTYDRAVFATPNGVTTKVIFKLSGFLHVVDKADRIVYRYSDEGIYMDLNSLDPVNTDAEGITTNGTDFWVPDEVDDETYKYDSSVTLDSMWSLDLLNASSTGVTTDGTNIWVADANDTVYKYDMVGTSVSSFSLDAANTDPTGITTDNFNLWVVDSVDDLVYKYDMSGVFDSTFALSAENADPSGITTDGANIWVVDEVDDMVYKYEMAGTNIATATFTLDGTNTDPTGITVKPR